MYYGFMHISQMAVLTKKENIPEWESNNFNKTVDCGINNWYSNKSVRFMKANSHDVFIYDIKAVNINYIVNYVILKTMWNITQIKFSIKLNNNNIHTCLQKDKQTNICLVCHNYIQNNINNLHYYNLFFSEFYNITNIYNHNFHIHNECLKNLLHLYISFVYLYNIMKNGNLLNGVIANSLDHVKIKKAEILPAQARKKKDIIAFAIIGFLSGNKSSHKSEENKENNNDKNNDKNETCSNNGGESKRSGTGDGNGDEGNGEGSENDENDDNANDDYNSSDTDEEEDEQKKGKKAESPNANHNVKDAISKNKTRGVRNKKKKKKSEDEEEYISNYQNEGDVRSMKRKRKKKQLGDGEYIIDDMLESNYESDGDELVNENNLPKESDDEYLYDQELKIYTDEDIVEEGQILKDEVYSGDSEFLEDDYTSGRKRKKRKTKKTLKKEKKIIIKNGKNISDENKTAITTNQNISNDKKIASQVEEKGNVPSTVEMSNIVSEENEMIRIEPGDKTIYLSNEDMKKYAKVINKIKQSLDKENIKVDTYSISKNIVENVIRKYKNKLDIKMKLFSICSNLLRNDNSELRKKILNGVIHSSDLANMDASDLAPISLQNKRKEHEKKYFYESIYLRENYINIKNTKNNEEEYYQPNILYDDKLKQNDEHSNKRNNSTSRSRSNSSNRSSNASNFDKIDKTNESYNDKKNVLIETADKNNSGENNEAFSQQIINNLSNVKEKKKKKSKDEEDDNNTYIIPSIEKYALENTYENLKAAYKNMPKYASSPILTFLDNSYNRVISIIEASKNEEL
ncbi:conserved Plasmodium protein, unknown function [Plasmodium chabaudi adami]|uniref:TFIIS central domain-containing protein n=1 Tax=Plasmodium chabaudi adami TaxID=5826 RepID=A0A1D3RWN9_PLACE|nr:conserved Plasmodium protein, unknown function [Plasmodium chabaudi adami]